MIWVVGISSVHLSRASLRLSPRPTRTINRHGIHWWCSTFTKEATGIRRRSYGISDRPWKSLLQGAWEETTHRRIILIRGPKTSLQQVSRRTWVPSSEFQTDWLGVLLQRLVTSFIDSSIWVDGDFTSLPCCWRACAFDPSEDFLALEFWTTGSDLVDYFRRVRERDRLQQQRMRSVFSEITSSSQERVL